MSPDLRSYLERLAVGDLSELEPWRAWCDENRAELEAELGRAGYLKLKFEPAVAVPMVLADLAIELDADALSDALADAANGLPWNPVPRDPHGVRALFLEGRIAEGEGRIASIVEELARSNHPSKGQLLGEMVLDARFLVRKGFIDEGLAIAAAIANLDATDDLVRPAIDDARGALDELGRSRSSGRQGGSR